MNPTSLRWSAAAQEASANDDASWFLAHPGVTRRTRKPFPNEWPAQIGHVIAVEVLLLGDGLRARIPQLAETGGAN